MSLSRLVMVALLSLAACSGEAALGPDGGAGARDGSTGSGVDGGTASTSDGGGLVVPPDAGPVVVNDELRLTGTVRDFREANPIDFENPKFASGGEMPDRGLVKETLGADGKPEYAKTAAGTLTTSGPENFQKWFHDVAGVNQKTDLTIVLKNSNGGSIYTYDNQAFFPIDGKLFGNEGRGHNFHFTYELHTLFTYQGGEEFTFNGDDDLWVFINKQRVIDLGGIHSAEDGKVKLDEVAAQIGLVKGKSYSLELFFAERHVTGSHFRIETSIGTLETEPN